MFVCLFKLLVCNFNFLLPLHHHHHHHHHHLMVCYCPYYSQEHRCMTMYVWEEGLRETTWEQDCFKFSLENRERDDSCLVCSGSWFHAAGPECENARFPNFVRSHLWWIKMFKAKKSGHWHLDYLRQSTICGWIEKKQWEGEDETETRRRRRDRYAEGVEGVRNGIWVSPPQPTKGLEIVVSCRSGFRSESRPKMVFDAFWG